MMYLFFYLILSTTNTWAVPLQINQQGRIKDSAGGEIMDRTKGHTFHVEYRYFSDIRV